MPSHSDRICHIPATSRFRVTSIIASLILCVIAFGVALPEPHDANAADTPQANATQRRKNRKKSPFLAPVTAAPSSPWTNETMTQHHHGIEENTPRYSLRVEYPSFGLPSVDKELALWARRQVDTFTNGLEGIPANDSSHFALVITYQHVQPSLHCASVLFYISTETGGPQPDKGMATFTYDMTTGKTLEYSDIFGESRGLLPFLSSYSQKTIMRLPWAREHAPRVQAGTTPDALNFTFFAITRSGLTLYFPPGQAGPLAAGTLEVSIPFEELRAYRPAAVLWGLPNLLPSSALQ